VLFCCPAACLFDLFCSPGALLFLCRPGGRWRRSGSRRRRRRRGRWRCCSWWWGWRRWRWRRSSRRRRRCGCCRRCRGAGWRRSVSSRGLRRSRGGGPRSLQRGFGLGDPAVEVGDLLARGHELLVSELSAQVKVVDLLAQDGELLRLLALELYVLRLRLGLFSGAADRVLDLVEEPHGAPPGRFPSLVP
jgi:hypothetical protein